MNSSTHSKFSIVNCKFHRGGLVAALVCLWLSAVTVQGEDWPYFRGKSGLGVWEETGILEKFPENGLADRVRWRTPIRQGYSGPGVGGGRVFVTDFVWTTRPRGIERAVALDEKTGAILWTREWEANYTSVSYDRGPRATPTVDDDRVYFQGAAGALLCLSVKTGEIVWKKDLVAEYPGPREKWLNPYGFVAPTLVDGNLLIAKVGGEPKALVVAFDKRTGKEVWRALPAGEGPGWSPLVIITHAGKRQLLVWHDRALSALDPATGEMYWNHEWNVGGMAIHPPIQVGNLLVLSHYFGARVLELGDNATAAPQVLWQTRSGSETVTESVQTMIMTPIVIGDYIYGIDTHGELRCVNLKTGGRVWDTQAVTRERALHSTAHFVRNGDRFFINNDFGELIIGKLSPEGYQEISRTKLIKPTMPATQRRTGGFVNWTHPAYANKHIITRNDEEILSISLAAEN